MALWGIKDNKTASGTIAIASSGAVTGSSTSFTTQAKIGNTIKANGVEYEIVTITDNTHCKVIMGKNNGNGAVTVVNSGTSYTLSEKPAFVAHESSQQGDFGGSGDSSKVFGVNTAEIIQGSNDVVEVAIVNAGSGYLEIPNVTFASGTQTATATISGGKLTKVTITGSGAYASVPTVYIDVPKRTITTAHVSTSTEVFTYTGHGLTTGDRIRYNNAGGTTATGLTSGTTYYANVINADTFYAYDTKAHAVAGGATGKINVSGTGNNNQFFDLLDQTTATVQAALGSGDGGTQVTHSGWVRRTVGTGGRAGRIFYETLVANGATAATTSDAADDVQFPDN
jgi:hypothetical protein